MQLVCQIRAHCTTQTQCNCTLVERWLHSCLLQRASTNCYKAKDTVQRTQYNMIATAVHKQ
eukprot:16763-Heterococcus_DN1.PRE.2